MKYRHQYHAGNFADVHKHVTLLALITALRRKEKGFAYFETHAGRGLYELKGAGSEAEGGADRFTSGTHDSAELRALAHLIAQVRAERRDPRAYPGSPLIAARELRAQDHGIVSEVQVGEARALASTLRAWPAMRVEEGDGFERLRAWLPPRERRGLIFIDPPYEDSHVELGRVTQAVTDALQRFETGVIAAWFPIKDERDSHSWTQAFARTVRRETLLSELWLYPRDSRVALNGSGMLIVNPPYLLAERMAGWLPELHAQLDIQHTGGSGVRWLTRAANAPAAAGSAARRSR